MYWHQQDNSGLSSPAMLNIHYCSRLRYRSHGHVGRYTIMYALCTYPITEVHGTSNMIQPSAPCQATLNLDQSITIHGIVHRLRPENLTKRQWKAWNRKFARQLSLTHAQFRRKDQAWSACNNTMKKKKWARTLLPSQHRRLPCRASYVDTVRNIGDNVFNYRQLC